MVEIAGLGALQAKLGYRFRDIKLLKKALVHKSLVNESDLRALDSNERLEFLGDAALGLVVTEFICERFPDKLEGDLTALRAAVVNLDALAARAEALDLGEYVATGRGGILDLERSRRTVLGRSFEAVVGAASVDGGRGGGGGGEREGRGATGGGESALPARPRRRAGAIGMHLRELEIHGFK